MKLQIHKTSLDIDTTYDEFEGIELNLPNTEAGHGSVFIRLDGYVDIKIKVDKETPDDITKNVTCQIMKAWLYGQEISLPKEEIQKIKGMIEWQYEQLDVNR